MCYNSNNYLRDFYKLDIWNIDLKRDWLLHETCSSLKKIASFKILIFSAKLHSCKFCNFGFTKTPRNQSRLLYLSSMKRSLIILLWNFWGRDAKFTNCHSYHFLSILDIFFFSGLQFWIHISGSSIESIFKYIAGIFFLIVLANGWMQFCAIIETIFLGNNEANILPFLLFKSL